MSKEKQPKDPAEQGKEIKTAADLKQDSHNYRKHSDTNKARIKKSIDEAGLGRSVVIDADGVLVAGNGVQQVIDKDTPVRVIETDGTELVVVKRTDLHTDDPRRKTLALADNATSDDVEWDFDAIAEDWTEDEAEGWGVEWPNDEEEIEQKEAQEDDFDPDSVTDTVCKKGDIWKLGNHRLMCGDSTDAGDVALLMDGEKADMVFTDPPYNVDYDGNGTREKIQNDNFNSDEEAGEKLWLPAFTNLYNFAKDKCAYYLTMPQGGTHMMMMMMMMMMKAGWQVKHELIWRKQSLVLGRQDYNYQHEPISYGWKKSHNFVGKGKFATTSVWEFDRPTASKEHPTMKPVDLVAECMLDNSLEGFIVLDLFGGSGTTMIAAEQLGRRCYMMELDPHYCDVIIARWEKLTGNKAEKLE